MGVAVRLGREVVLGCWMERQVVLGFSWIRGSKTFMLCRATVMLVVGPRCE